MAKVQYVKAQKISMKNSADFNENWLQQMIADDPSILGLGDLILKDQERAQPHAGRLDLLLQDSDSTDRFEVEIQLGRTDESHIIRTIEYWDIERKRYPQYDHTAVIVAEDITSRFLNVISLFNGFIPLVAIQMNAVQIGNQISLICSTVLDHMTLGLVEEEDEQDVADRVYWEKRGTKETVAMADRMLALINEIDPGNELKYNKYYIGLAKDGQTNNYVVFRPQKNAMRLEFRMPKSDEFETKLEEAGIDVIGYDNRWRRYSIRMAKGDVKKYSEMLKSLLNDVKSEAGV